MSDQLRRYSSVATAEVLLALANRKGYVLNVTKVQKLLYIIYGLFLAKDGISILDEQPQAWPYGPVFPRTRNKVKFEKVYSIEVLEKDQEYTSILQDEILCSTMEKVIEKYGGFTAKALSDWSHQKESPWDLTTKEPNFVWSNPIKDEYIKEYFSKMIIS